MTAGLRPYPEYKDSGLPWLGKLPAHWEWDRLKWLVRNVKEQMLVNDLSLNYIALEHVESWTGRVKQAKAANVESLVKRFQPDDLLFGKLRPYLAKVTRASNSGVCVGEFFVLRVRDHRLTPRYAEHLLRSAQFIHLVDGSTYGARMPRAEWGSVGTIPIPLPAIDEQKAIADYLDADAEKIRRFIHNRRRLIEVLNEQKQAIINRAVTRGLDPNVPLKPSGIEWLGDIPKHWVVKPLKRWVKINELVLPESTDTDYTFQYLEIGCVGTGLLVEKPVQLRFGDAPSRARRVLRIGDTIISTVRTYLKAVYFVADNADDLVASTGFAALTPGLGIVPEFLGIAIRSTPFIDRVTAHSIGIAYPAISETRLGAFPIAVPPSIDEQAAIVTYIRRETEVV